MDADTGRIIPAISAAKKRGILFDVGHGFGSFSWSVTKTAAKEQFWPDTISTDLHAQSCTGPAYDLPLVMSKLLHVGMPLYDIIKSVTQTPAKVLRKEKELGSLSAGTVGDITILKIVEGNLELEDSFGQVETVSSWFEPIGVFKSGESVTIIPRLDIPNKSKLNDLKANLLLNSK